MSTELLNGKRLLGLAYLIIAIKTRRHYPRDGIVDSVNLQPSGRGPRIQHI